MRTRWIRARNRTYSELLGVGFESEVSVFGPSDGLGVDVVFSVDFSGEDSGEVELFSDSRFFDPVELPRP